MMLLGAKACVTLLWGISVLFMETESASIPETDGSSGSSNSTAEPNKANSALTAAHIAHSQTERQSVTTVMIHRPAEAAVATATTDAAMSPTRVTEEVAVNTKGDSSTALFVTTVTATAGTLGPQWRHSSAAAVTSAAGDAQATRDTTMSETAKPTQGQSQQQSSNSSTDMTTPAAASTAPSATAAVSSPYPMSASTPSPSTTARNFTDGAPHFIHSPSVSMTAETVAPSTEATPAANSSSSPVTTQATSTSTEATPAANSSSSPVTTQATSTSTELPTMSQPVSHARTRTSTSQLPATTGLRSTTESPTTTAFNDSSTSTSVMSTNTTGILIPRVPKRLPVPANRSTPAPTATTHEVSKSPQSTEVQPCSTRGVVKHCLIAIASLGGLATIFMVTTIVLCAKLSARKYKVKKPQPATEMMCISALLPERNYTYTRQRNPISNGVLVFPSGGDSEEDGGDNLTLSSFLPENDRYV